MNDNENNFKNALSHFSGKFYESYSFSEDENFISSPLGAWLLLAQTAGANSKELSSSARHKIEELLGLSLEASYDYANELLTTSPSVVKTANAVWVNENHVMASSEDEWLLNLMNANVATVHSVLPTQEELNSWAVDKTLGIIDKFPVDVSSQENIILILANVLATKISWGTPFDEVRNNMSAWNVPTVLFADQTISQKIVQDLTDDEMYAVVVNKGEGLRVGSVIALNPNLSEAHVLQVAQKIMTSDERIATIQPDTLESNNLWEISNIESGQGDIYTAQLPAWEANSSIDFVKDLHFPVSSASEAFFGAPTLNLAANNFSEINMLQVAKAKFNKKGFEAAALSTSLMLGAASIHLLENRKHVDVRFNRSYAVVAIARERKGKNFSKNLWSDLPVFSAWVNVASEVSDEEF